jgi:penicillin-binding protein 1C
VPLRVRVDAVDGREGGVYAPMNYDERFHGPVRLREALGSSLNVPAVWTTEQLGVGAVLERLRSLGFALDRADDWYGPAIALGDGEVSLLELANAYAAIARGGTWRPARAVRRVVRAGAAVEAPDGGERRIMPEPVAAMLADARARVGEQSALDLPFEVAAKTGTSKGSRDNWTVGFTREVTVAVWVGNFDGSAMHGTSGITGAAPLFHAVMEAAMRGRDARPLRIASTGGAATALVPVEVCPLSGARTTGACPHAVREWMTPAARDAVSTCLMHETVRIDRRNGLRAGPGCAAEHVLERTFERYERAERAWAAGAGRPTAPDAFSPLCPGGPTPSGAPGATSVRIGWPADGADFVIDPDRARAQQRLQVRVEADDAVHAVELLVDGRVVGRMGSPFVAWWTLSPGDHVLVARAQGAARAAQSAPTSIRVR